MDHDLLVEGARNLRDYLQSQGYFEAEVEFKEQRVINDRAAIDYLINTGKRHKLVAIEITGNRYFTTEAIRERMFLQTATFLQFPHGRYSENLLRRDEDPSATCTSRTDFATSKVTPRIEDDYRERSATSRSSSRSRRARSTSSSDLKVDGIEQLDKREMLALLSSVAGPAVQRVQRGGGSRHHPGAVLRKGLSERTFEWSSSPRPQPHRVDLQFVIHEGQQQFVREVLITRQPHDHAPQLINRNITLNPGDPLSPTEMTETQRRLYDLGVFARVDAAIQNPEGETDRKYVLYNMDEARRYSHGVRIRRGAGRASAGARPAWMRPPGRPDSRRASRWM